MANDGEEAVAAVENGGFDLILMDVQMPKMSGLEAAAVIRSREHGTVRHVPIVAMTANAMKGDKERGLEAGMDGYVSKPVQAGDMLEMIARFTSSTGEAPDAASSIVPGQDLRQVAPGRGTTYRGTIGAQEGQRSCWLPSRRCGNNGATGEP